MDNNIDSLKKLIDQVKVIGFWQRLFGWSSVRQQLVDASADLQKLVANIENLKDANQSLIASNTNINKDLRLANDALIRNESTLETLKSSMQSMNEKLIANTKEAAAGAENILNLTNRKNELEKELITIRSADDIMQLELKAIKQQNTELLSNEDIKREKYENDVATLTAIRQQIQDDRKKEIEDRNSIEIERLKRLKHTWATHQENVRGLIRNICNKHTIEYFDKVPFKGEPDNTLKICDEFVIFDAKSPASDDLSNFPAYLKDQAEKAKKYAKQENVKTDIFLVVPTNTLDKLATFVYNLADYNVYIISADSLEQIILGLKKIEEYEFAKQLSPEERDNICRVLGKFAHLTKRRIQIDSFFAKQFIELAYKCESDLPSEILEKVVEFERSEKLNPPQEKRAKAINIKDLEKDTGQLKTEALSKGIFIDDLKISNNLNELQLYVAAEQSASLDK